jgi:hypothetical protein
MKAIPEGWVAISQYDTRPPGADEVGPSGDYARILKALKLKPCPIQHYRDGRGWVARQSDIEDYLASRKASSSPSPKSSSCKPASDAASFDAALSMAEMRLTLGRIELILERLAVAAETLATQSHEPAGSWRDMNGEVMN